MDVERERSRLGPAPNIMVIRPLMLGDLLLLVPGLRALKAAFPDSQITLVGLSWLRDLALRFRYVDRFLGFPGWPGVPQVAHDPERAEAFLQAARHERYDLALGLYSDGRVIGSFVRQVRARVAAGFYSDEETARLLDVGLPYRQSEHEVHKVLRLLAALGVPPAGQHLELPLLPSDHAEVDRLPELGARLPRPWVGLHPGASSPSRRWPAEYFARVADALVDQFGASIVLLGGSGEYGLAERAGRLMRQPAVNLAERLSLGGLGALVGRLDLYLGNDSGPAHVAAALRVPSVVVFGSSDHRRWAALDRQRHRVARHVVPCQPCDYWACPIGLPCLRDLQPARVLDRATALLKGHQSRRVA